MKSRFGFAAAVTFLMCATTGASVSAMGMGNHVNRSKGVGMYHLVLKIGLAEKMSMSGMGGERTMGGKMASCSMAMHMAKTGMMGSRCNHHVELHVYSKDNGSVRKHAHVHIRLYCIKMHMSYTVPIMRMEGAKMGAMDLHYGNNMHLPQGWYTVFVKVNGTTATFAHVHIR
jgi:hypothetical protein